VKLGGVTVKIPQSLKWKPVPGLTLCEGGQATVIVVTDETANDGR